MAYLLYCIKEKIYVQVFAKWWNCNSPTLAMVGEGGYSEAVIPLNNNLIV